MTKFNAQRTNVNGIKFDSIFESRVYRILKDCNVAVATQYPIYLLQENKWFKATNWKCDFLVYEKEKRLLIEAKSAATITREFSLKMRILSHNAPLLYENLLFVFPSTDFDGWENHGKSISVNNLEDYVNGIFK